jgi:hypothetical protein
MPVANLPQKSFPHRCGDPTGGRKVLRIRVDKISATDLRFEQILKGFLPFKMPSHRRLRFSDRQKCPITGAGNKTTVKKVSASMQETILPSENDKYDHDFNFLSEKKTDLF